MACFSVFGGSSECCSKNSIQETNFWQQFISLWSNKSLTSQLRNLMLKMQAHPFSHTLQCYFSPFNSYGIMPKQSNKKTSGIRNGGGGGAINIKGELLFWFQIISELSLNMKPHTFFLFCSLVVLMHFCNAKVV